MKSWKWHEYALVFDAATSALCLVAVLVLGMALLRVRTPAERRDARGYTPAEARAHANGWHDRGARDAERLQARALSVRMQEGDTRRAVAWREAAEAVRAE